MHQLLQLMNTYWKAWQKIFRRLIGCTNILEYSLTRQSQKCTPSYTVYPIGKCEWMIHGPPKVTEDLPLFWANLQTHHNDNDNYHHIYYIIELSHRVMWAPPDRVLLVCQIMLVAVAWYLVSELSGVVDYSQLLKPSSHSYVAVHYFWSLSDCVVISTMYCTSTI
jgi:hypothetical protein